MPGLSKDFFTGKRTKKGPANKYRSSNQPNPVRHHKYNKYNRPAKAHFHISLVMEQAPGYHPSIPGGKSISNWSSARRGKREKTYLFVEVEAVDGLR